METEAHYGSDTITGGLALSDRDAATRPQEIQKSPSLCPL